jgi:hypothetical protein
MSGRQTFKDQGAEFLRSANASETYDYQENMPAPTPALAGADVVLRLDEGAEWIGLRFGGDTLEWECGSGDERESEGAGPYQAFLMGPDIYFVEFLFEESRSLALVLDRGTGVVTTIRGSRSPEGEIDSVLMGGYVEGVGTAAGERHPQCSLAGTGIQNDYAHNVKYQHVYLNDAYETWVGVDGPQKGQADTEEYVAFKIADAVYCTFWNERVLTTQMTFVFNFDEGRCVGQVFGTTAGEPVHNTIGSTTAVVHSDLVELDVPRLRTV